MEAFKSFSVDAHPDDHSAVKALLTISPFSSGATSCTYSKTALNSDEFHGPVRQMESRVEEETQKTRLYSLVILGGALLLIGLVVSIYGNRLAGKIKSLTEVTERISVGDLDAEQLLHGFLELRFQ